MDIQSIALAAGLAWASGLRLYVVMFLVGIAGHFGWIVLPTHLEVLANPIVLGTSGTLAVAEFFADKVPVLRQPVGRRPHLHPDSGRRAARRGFGGRAGRRQPPPHDRRRAHRRHDHGGQPLHEGRQPRGHQPLARAVLQLGGVPLRGRCGAGHRVARHRGAGDSAGRCCSSRSSWHCGSCRSSGAGSRRSSGASPAGALRLDLRRSGFSRDRGPHPSGQWPMPRPRQDVYSRQRAGSSGDGRGMYYGFRIRVAPEGAPTTGGAATCAGAGR